MLKNRISDLCMINFSYLIASTLELSFATKELRDLCEHEGAAIEQFGERVARNLISRIADLKAADTPCDLLVGNPRPNSDRNYLINIGEGLCACFTVNQKAYFEKNHSVDWSSVYRIKITSIGDNLYD
jgi:hypothetical protein